MSLTFPEYYPDVNADTQPRTTSESIVNILGRVVTILWGVLQCAMNFFEGLRNPVIGESSSENWELEKLAKTYENADAVFFQDASSFSPEVRNKISNIFYNNALEGCNQSQETNQTIAKAIRALMTKT